MPQTIAIRGRLASATIFVSNLIMLDRRKVVFLSAYGPSQEVRAFAQLLDSREADIELADDKALKVWAASFPRLITNMDNGYSGLYLVPNPETRLIIGESKEECFGIYSRFLDQQQFVHRDWYRQIFDMGEEVTPLIGTKKCFRTIENVGLLVQQKLKDRTFVLPEATASIDIEVTEAVQKA